MLKSTQTTPHQASLPAPAGHSDGITFINGISIQHNGHSITQKTKGYHSPSFTPYMEGATASDSLQQKYAQMLDVPT
ncbi:MAG: hypothetical protein ACRDE2_18090, partial [Chitinophagaceae bacterium]